MAVTIDGTNGITNVNGSATTPAETGTDTDTGIYYGTNTVSLATGGTQRFTIDSSGNVGIGVTPSAAKLHVETSANEVEGSFRNSSASYSSDLIQAYQTNASATLTSFHLLRAYSSGPTVRFHVRGDGEGYFAGNVGIGTSTPGYKLDVTGSSVVARINSSNNNNVLAISYNGTIGGYFGANGTNLIFGNNAGSEAMRIDSSGNVLVGTTSTTNIAKLTSYNSGVACVIANTNTSNLSTPAIQISKGDNNTTTSNTLVQFLSNGFTDGQGQINANGTSQVAFGSFSDRRLKENITDLPPQLTNICALRPVEFDYKTGGHQVGFIAQEMQQVYPDVVGENNDGMLTITGWSKTEARLVKAIQELKAEFDAYKAAHP